MSKRLTPIPSPPGHLLREVSARVLPLGVFIAVLSMVMVLWKERFMGGSLDDARPPRGTMAFDSQDDPDPCAGEQEEQELQVRCLPATDDCLLSQ